MQHDALALFLHSSLALFFGTLFHLLLDQLLLCTLSGKSCRNISESLLLGQDRPVGFPNKTTTTTTYARFDCTLSVRRIWRNYSIFFLWKKPQIKFGKAPTSANKGHQTVIDIQKVLTCCLGYTTPMGRQMGLSTDCIPLMFPQLRMHIPTYGNISVFSKWLIRWRWKTFLFQTISKTFILKRHQNLGGV